MKLITQIFIITLIFCITLWLQNSDDKKYNNQRILYYDKYKLPIFFSAVIGLILNIINYIQNDTSPYNIYDQEIYIGAMYPCS